MFIKSFIFVVTLWSCYQVRAESSDFAVLDSEYSVLNEPIIIENMPRVRSQDSVPDCIGFAAATVAQYYICNTENNTACADLPNNKEISPLSMIAWAHPNTEAGGVAEPRNYSNIQLGKKGGTAAQCLLMAKDTFSFKADSCYPHDQLASKYGSKNLKKIEAILGVIESEYKKYKTESGFCEECLAGAVSDLNVKMSVDDLKKVMDTKSTYGEFLYKTVFNDCREIVKGRPQPKYDSFPKTDQESNYDSMIGKVKQVLSSGNPLTFDDVCIEYSGTNCKTTHSLVISGYRKMCKKDGTCRDVVKVHNSFGKDWQAMNNDGWVDARTLFQTSLKSKDRAKNTLAWYH